MLKFVTTARYTDITQWDSKQHTLHQGLTKFRVHYSTVKKDGTRDHLGHTRSTSHFTPSKLLRLLESTDTVLDPIRCFYLTASAPTSTTSASTNPMPPPPHTTSITPLLELAGVLDSPSDSSSVINSGMRNLHLPRVLHPSVHTSSSVRVDGCIWQSNRFFIYFTVIRWDEKLDHKHSLDHAHHAPYILLCICQSMWFLIQFTVISSGIRNDHVDHGPTTVAKSLFLLLSFFCCFSWCLFFSSRTTIFISCFDRSSYSRIYKFLGSTG